MNAEKELGEFNEVICMNREHFFGISLILLSVISILALSGCQNANNQVGQVTKGTLSCSADCDDGSSCTKTYSASVAPFCYCQCTHVYSQQADCGCRRIRVN